MSVNRSSLARLSRREWTGLLAAAPLAAQIMSTKPPVGSPAEPAPGATPEQRLQKALTDVRDTGALLSKIEVPMNVEPAFSFKA